MSSDVSLKLDAYAIRCVPRYMTRALEMIVANDQRKVVRNAERASDFEARARCRQVANYAGNPAGPIK